MRQNAVTGLTTVALCVAVPAFVFTTFVLGAGEWEEAGSTCAALNEDFPNGVAMDETFARRQAAQGNRRPAHNAEARDRFAEAEKAGLDLDHDGTACEQPETGTE